MSGLPHSNAVAWPVEDLQRALEPLLAGITMEVMAEVDSTNSELMRRIRQGQHAPLLLVAERQSAGRGRQGRSWLSHTDPQGQPHAHASLTFSLGLPLQRNDLSGLSLAVGVALADALHPAIGLKWPNDLWWDGRKLGGILIETANQGAHRFVVIGAGLNLSPPPGNDLRNPAAGLQQLLPDLDAPALLTHVVRPLVQALVRFEAGGFAPVQAAFAKRDVLLGKPLDCSDGRSGTGAGVDARGALLLHTAHGLETVVSDEVSVRPFPHHALP
ncbi:MAG: biotin--[acetyl-CoA-carboxylase] ligase [Betaproteobacteria bacterium]|nr:biotin--[acetyl-CoA-carboxylase] ligase [Betaproteobacteria bacterium]